MPGQTIGTTIPGALAGPTAGTRLRVTLAWAPVRRRLTPAVAAALATTAVLAAPLPTHAAWQDNARTQSPERTWQAARTNGIWMFGDSITAADSPALAALLRASGRPLAVDATPGIPTRPAVDLLVERLRRSGAPQRLVMALGTNDRDAGAVGAQVARVMNAVPPTTRVYWVNVWKHRGLNGTTENDRSVTAAINAVIGRADRRHANLETVDWWATVEANPRHFLRDGVHTLPAGRAARNHLILDAVSGRG